MRKWLKLPDTATAPFCPSEVKGAIVIPPGGSFWSKLFKFMGPGLLVSVGYMDPGNWATDIEAGSKFGYNLLFVVLLSSLAAIGLQILCLRLGVVTGRDLAQHSRARFPRPVNLFLWFLAELALIATDLAEVLGSALAFKLLLGVSMPYGVAITALDTFLVLGLKGKGFRQVEAIILGLIFTIGACYFVELFMLKPDWGMVAHGYLPLASKMTSPESWYLAIGILGATVMPHNLYLHSSIVQTRLVADTVSAKKEAVWFGTADTVGSLFLAFLVNSAILILAASAFHATGRTGVADIQDAYHLLDPIVGGSLASFLFAIALLASGQSSTFTGTIAGQVVFEGYLDIKMPCWKRRIITRGLALIPAFIGVIWLGDNSVGKLLVMSQVALSLQLPFAIAPLILFTSDRSLMGLFTNRLWSKTTAWALCAAISAANIWMVYQAFAG